MTATDDRDHRTATVTGRFTSLVSKIALQGDAVGAGCDGQTFTCRPGRFVASRGGGGG